MKNQDARFAEFERRISAIEKKLKIRKDTNGEISDDLITLYGRYVDKSMAAKILGVTRATVYTMLADGRITASHSGTRVSVESIKAYIESPKRKGERKWP